MRKIPLIILALTMTALAQGQALFRIVQGGKVGYIDSSGQMVIPPVFRAGLVFSEGLCGVRKDGRFGFIDSTGAWRILPQYDFVTSFQNGYARAARDKKTWIIDTAGRQVLPGIYRIQSLATKSKAIVSTSSYRYGIMDLINYRLIVDTIFTRIDAFTHGTFAVETYVPWRSKEASKAAAIDTNGNFIVPFGKYDGIQSFSDDIACAYHPRAWKKYIPAADVDGIDSKAKVLFTKTFNPMCGITGQFHEGLAQTLLFKYWLFDGKVNEVSTANMYFGYSDKQFDIVYNDTTCTQANDFSCGHALVQISHSGYRIIDRNFHFVPDKVFSSIGNQTFINNYAAVELDTTWGIIDTTGNFTVDPVYSRIDAENLDQGLFFFTREDRERHGIADMHNKIIVPPVIREFLQRKFTNGLIPTIVEDRLTWFNTSGKIVWQQPINESDTLYPMDIETISWDRYNADASFPPGLDTTGMNIRANCPEKLDHTELFPGNKLSIVIDTTHPVVHKIGGWGDSLRFQGWNLFVANTTSDTARVIIKPVYGLDILLQALDSGGTWRDIELRYPDRRKDVAIPLQPQYGWHFTIPKFDGELKTKIRARLRYNNPSNPGQQLTIFSNTVEAGINPGQFWNRSEIRSNGETNIEEY